MVNSVALLVMCAEPLPSARQHVYGACAGVCACAARLLLSQACCVALFQSLSDTFFWEAVTVWTGRFIPPIAALGAKLGWRHPAATCVLNAPKKLELIFLPNSQLQEMSKSPKVTELCLLEFIVGFRIGEALSDNINQPTENSSEMISSWSEV